jgi:outer membrane protein assembly factor BamB
MSTAPPPPRMNDDLGRAHYQAAVGSAIVAGVFTLVVCGFLAAAHIRTQRLDFQNSEDLTALRAGIVKASDAGEITKLKEELRARDLQMRAEYFHRQAFSRSGGYLIGAGALIFVIAAARAAACRKRLPMPAVDSQAARRAVRMIGLARVSVIALGVALGGSGLLLGVLASRSPTDEAAAPSPAGTQPQPFPDPTGGGTETPGTAPAMVGEPPSPAEIAKQWPRFRGPGGNGVSAYTNVPATWNAKTGENILWQTPVPMPGENSPVVWGNRLFLTGADEKNRVVYCFDTATGKLLWQQPVVTPQDATAQPPDKLDDTGFAAPTAATDGRYVAAIFVNGDLAVFTVDGRPVWAKHLGPFMNTYGYSSSLNIYRNTVIVLLDEGKPAKTKSRITAFDLATGKTVWQTARPVPASWATPALFSTDKGDQVVAAGNPWVIAYDPAGGKELWRANCLDGDVAPSPVYGGGLVFACQDGAKLSAIRTDGTGDVTKTAVLWGAEDGLPDIVSPLTDGKLIWIVTTAGMITCYNVKDGTKAYEKELEEEVNASPSLVGDKIFVFAAKKGAGDEKTTVLHLVGAGPQFKELGKAELNETVHASPAFLDGRIYIRGVKTLFTIGKK